jgi:DNA-binding GntR family transcriptional regulator
MRERRAGRRPAFETKSAWAYGELREMIADGELPAGSRLVLRRLADDLGLSEMPVREALRMLQRDGLVAFESHRGATVVAISGADVLEGISVRMWLEVLALREATPRHGDVTLRAARAAFERVERARERADADAFSRANHDLHRALEAPAGGLVVATIEDLWNRVRHARRSLSLFQLRPDEMRRAQAEHGAILDAVAAGDADAAAGAMETHRASSLAAWGRALAEPRGATAPAPPPARTRP